MTELSRNTILEVDDEEESNVNMDVPYLHNELPNDRAKRVLRMCDMVEESKNSA
eukprot:CAMPEP_0118717394 /NCGR_PEP_ID=MMETSP0800-20121206/28118_1 /TAXON_ID=210618 ORGANISM="Striatella unipunctata, Strain CCMP2910" /NCGR_SAMPLE_ID=MMETSP0800 /ASSEMBLY_ACC=CAM_ASM_000638 /LENGTH=53 /DNA_ID=CAMNT_0006624093 /DNA_START=57 /DNA_END=215 /DNA_ORIENTATION=+